MSTSKQIGSSLIEVLVTIVILLIGLLGLAGLQARSLTAQMEVYQRSQAISLVKDMSDRINANRINAASYVVASIGTGATCPASGATTASRDLNEWCNALLGAAEMQGASSVGAMIGARGCITQTVVPASGVASQYVIAVAWQGLNSTSAPANTCGAGQYGSDERKRRVIALPINIADLN